MPVVAVSQPADHPGAEALHARTNRLDHARALLAGTERQRRQHLILALNHQQVGKIDARCVHIHQHLARTGHRIGKIAKCQFCRHLQAKGGMPACADVCPTGATLFGLVKDLEQEATRRLEAALSKQRIFEIYLNVIEWGDGVFGAEAAARHYYGTGASNLTDWQAARLAAIGPSSSSLVARIAMPRSTASAEDSQAAIAL